nr:MBG domain-containing protein [Nibribacter ruber]
MVAVTINPTPNAPIIEAQNFLTIDNATVGSLPGGNGSYKWYATETSTSALDNSTVLSSGTYYVAETTSSCESRRTPVEVSIKKAQPVISWAAAGTIAYGTTLLGKLNAKASFNGTLVEGTFVYKHEDIVLTNSTLLNASATAYPLTVEFTPSNTTNFKTASGTNSIVVNKATASVTLDNLNQTFTGAALAASATTSAAGTSSFSFSYTKGGAPVLPSEVVNAGTYGVTATLVNGNYEGSATGTFVIKPKPVVITPTAGQKKEYGQADPAFTFTNDGGLLEDAFSGKLSRDAGETVKSDFYAFSLDTLSAGGNYDLRLATGSTFAITPKPITLTADALAKKYGDEDPILTYKVTAGEVINQDKFSGRLTRAAGVNVGEYAISSTLANENYSITFVSNTFEIQPKEITASITAEDKVYDGTKAATVSGTAKGVGGVDIAVTTQEAEFSDANVGNGKMATAKVAISDGNYVLSATSATTLASITARPFTVVVANLEKVYGTPNPTLMGTVEGGVSEDDITVTYSTLATLTSNVKAGGYPIIATINASESVLRNYRVTNTPGVLTITQAPATITLSDLSLKYNGAPQEVTVLTSPVGLSVNVTYNGSATIPMDAAIYKVEASITDPNYAALPAEEMLTIGTAALTVTVAPKSKVYGSENPELTGNLSGVLGKDNIAVAYATTAEKMSAVTTSGYEITATLLDPDSRLKNYEVSITPSILTITKAEAAIAVEGFEGEYDSKPHGATGKAIGVMKEELEGLNLGDSFTNAPGGTANWTFSNPNYTDQSGAVNITIRKAPVTLAFGTLEYVYDGAEKKATASAYQNSASIELKGITVTGKGTNAGRYAVNASLENTNYVASAINGELVITPAASFVSMNDVSATYDGKEHAAAANATGAGALNTSEGILYSYEGASPMAYGPTKTPPINAGVYTVTATYPGDDNHSGSNATATITIQKAIATLTLADLSHVYDGLLKTASASTAPVGLAGVSVTGSGTDAGTYQVTASLDNPNYTAVSVTKDMVIDQAEASITIQPYVGVYDGNAHTASGVVTGVGSTDLTANLSFATSFTNAPGGVTTWKFAGGTNYKDASGSTNVTITKAAASISVNGVTVVYDGQAHGAFGTAAGVKGESLKELLLLGDTFKNTPGGTANWSFTGNDNYEPAKGSVMITISPRAASVKVATLSKTYGEQDPLLTGEVSGFIAADQVQIAYSRKAGETVADGPYAITASLSPVAALGNYSITNIPADLTITAKAITITADAKKKLVGTIDPALTYTITAGALVGTDAFSGALVRSVGEGKGTYAIGQGTLALNSNYALTYQGATLTIYAVPTVNLIASNPLAINSTSTVSATLGPDVFAPKWVVTSPAGTSASSSSMVEALNSLSITSSAVGVYTVTMLFEDGLGGKYTSAPVYAVFFDPSAGFVTGGGWVNSPIGQNFPYMQVEGKANFGFVSKYEKGAKVPTGNTEFQFQAAGMNFKSSVYEWLTVAGTRAQYKGSGTINGTGNYGFMLTAVDGDLGTTKSPDLFRIKIWDKVSNVVVYDNQLGASDDPSALSGSNGTTIGGGSIVIHDVVKGNVKPSSVVAQVDQPSGKGKFISYPNPFTEKVTFEFSFAQDEEYSLQVYSMSGTLVKNVTSGKAQANTPVQVQWGDNTVNVGVYLVRLVTSSGTQTLRVVRK